MAQANEIQSQQGRFLLKHARASRDNANLEIEMAERLEGAGQLLERYGRRGDGQPKSILRDVIFAALGLASVFAPPLFIFFKRQSLCDTTGDSYVILACIAVEVIALLFGVFVFSDKRAFGWGQTVLRWLPSFVLLIVLYLATGFSRSCAEMADGGYRTLGFILVFSATLVASIFWIAQFVSSSTRTDNEISIGSHRHRKTAQALEYWLRNYRGTDAARKSEKWADVALSLFATVIFNVPTFILVGSDPGPLLLVWGVTVFVLEIFWFLTLTRWYSDSRAMRSTLRELPVLVVAVLLGFISALVSLWLQGFEGIGAMAAEGVDEDAFFKPSENFWRSISIYVLQLFLVFATTLYPTLAARFYKGGLNVVMRRDGFEVRVGECAPFLEINQRDGTITVRERNLAPQRYQINLEILDNAPEVTTLTLFFRSCGGSSPLRYSHSILYQGNSYYVLGECGIFERSRIRFSEIFNGRAKPGVKEKQRYKLRMGGGVPDGSNPRFHLSDYRVPPLPI